MLHVFKSCGNNDLWRTWCRYLRNIKVSSKILKKLAEINYLKVWKQLSQAAPEDDTEAGPGAHWPRPSPGPPGSRRGQAGASGPEGRGPAPWGHQHCWQLPQKDRKYLAFLCKQMNTNPSGGPDHFRAPRHIIWQTVQGRRPARPSVAQPLRAASRCLTGSRHSTERKNRWWVPLPSRLYVWSLFRSSPTPRVSGLWGWLQVPPGGNSLPGGEEKGEGQDPWSEKAAALEAMEAGWKEYREENWQIHRGPQDPQFSSLTPIKLIIYSSNIYIMDLEECPLLCSHTFETFLESRYSIKIPNNDLVLFPTSEQYWALIRNYWASNFNK